MSNEKVVFVSGCYDILHGEHIEFFYQAKSLGTKLIVSMASDEVIKKYKKRNPSIPFDDRHRILLNLKVIDRLVVGRNLEKEGLDFYDEFMRLKPNLLVVRQDDKFSRQKKDLCNQTGAMYVVIPYDMNIHTTDIISRLRAPQSVPLRIDFAGGWLDMPKFAIDGGYIVNCTINKHMTIDKWDHKQSTGLGGSAAFFILSGKNGVKEELSSGVGWQDPACILETGLCVWRSGQLPILDCKVNPDFLRGRLALLYMGGLHNTAEIANYPRKLELIEKAGRIAREGVLSQNVNKIAEAIQISYNVQLEEGMSKLPYYVKTLAKKYCGSGHGGHAFYLFETPEDRAASLDEKLIPIEPYIRTDY